MNKALPLLPALEKFGHVQYLPIPDKVIKEGTEKVKAFCNMTYQVGQVLGKGSFGEISEVCKNAKCDTWVLKRILIKSGTSAAALQKMKKEVEKEVYIMRRFKGTKLAPDLQGAWQCGDKSFNLIMERFDRNMLQQGAKQFKENQHVQKYANVYYNETTFLLYTERQWNEMTRLAKELGKQGVLHGDGKPDNMLYREKDDRVVYTDFGFSGDYKFATPIFGWSYHMGCPAFQPVPNVPMYTLLFNWWELMMYFLIYTVTFIQLTDGRLLLFDWASVLNQLFEKYSPLCGNNPEKLLKNSKAAAIRKELMDQSGFKTWQNQVFPRLQVQPPPPPAVSKQKQSKETKEEITIKERTFKEFEHDVLQKGAWRRWMEKWEHVMKEKHIDPKVELPLRGGIGMIADPDWEEYQKYKDAAKMSPATPTTLILYAAVTEDQWEKHEKELNGYGTGTISIQPYLELFVSQSSAETLVRDARDHYVIFRVTIPAGTERLMYFTGGVDATPFFLFYNWLSRAALKTTGRNLIGTMHNDGINMVEVILSEK